MPRVQIQNIPYSLDTFGSGYLTSPITPATSGFCFAMWLKPPVFATNANQLYASWATALGTDGFFLDIASNTSNIDFSVFNGTSQLFTSQSTIPGNVWSHIVCMYLPNGACSLWVNGVAKVTGTSSGTMSAPTGQTLSFAKRSFTSTTAECQLSQIVWSNTTTQWTPAQITALYTQGTMPAGSTFYYPLTEGSGTVATDISGNGNNGTITNATYVTDSPSMLRTAVSSAPRVQIQNIPNAISFNGNNGYMTSPVVPSPSGFMMGFWIKTTSDSGYASTGEYINYNSAAGTDGFNFYRLTTASNSSYFEITFYNSTTSLGTPFAVVPKNTWVHVVVQYLPSGNAVLYINGVAKSTATMSGTMTASSSPVTFGRRAYTATYTGCEMSQFVLQNTATPWTQQQINQLYTQGVVPTGATVNYPLQEGGGTVAYDMSGNASNGTVTNGTWTNDVPTQSRTSVYGNIIPNGNLMSQPITSVVQTSVNYINGTAAGSKAPVFGSWYASGANSNNTVQFLSSGAPVGGGSIQMVTIANQAPFLFAGGNTFYGPTTLPIITGITYFMSMWYNITAASGSATTGLKAGVYLSTGGSTGGTHQITSNNITTTGGWVLAQGTFSTTGYYWVSPFVAIGTNDGAATLTMTAQIGAMTLMPLTANTRTLAS